MASDSAVKLTMRTVEALSATGRDTVYWDREVTGFGKSDLIFVSFIAITR